MKLDDGLFLSALEHDKVPIALREQLSFTKTESRKLMKRISGLPGISGCVLLSTCNRTELYISAKEVISPGQLLCQEAGVDYSRFESLLSTYTGESAMKHLMEVSAGLCSRIWGEDQIITQVKDAVILAREAESTDAILEVLFRTAVAAGKEVRSQVRLTATPVSAASEAIRGIEKYAGELKCCCALVIGNGNMGRLAANLLREKGCSTTVTLRSYRHGETLVPAGCSVVLYENRYKIMDQMDILISATVSPHFTVTYEQISKLKCPPRWVIDLALPRDVEPSIAQLNNVTLWNIDDLCTDAPQKKVPPKVEKILEEHMLQFLRWFNYRDSIPALERLKQAVTERVKISQEVAEEKDAALVEDAVSRTVDLLVGGMSGQINAEILEECIKKIRTHTRN